MWTFFEGCSSTDNYFHAKFHAKLANAVEPKSMTSRVSHRKSIFKRGKFFPFYPVPLRYRTPELPIISNAIHDISNRSSKFIHKVLMELGDSSYPLSARSQECSSEVKGVLFLAETSTWDNTDSSGVEETESVEFVWRAAFSLCCFDSFGGKVDGREEIHGTLDRVRNRYIIRRCIRTCGSWHSTPSISLKASYRAVALFFRPLKIPSHSCL